MPSIQVKGVPDEVHATLRRRAAEAGMSLQEYLLGRLQEEADSPTLAEVLERAGGRSGGHVPLTSAVEAVRADLGALRLERAPYGPLLERVWELRDNLTISGAVYVALAEVLAISLLTGDARLAGAPGVSCEVELMPGSER